VRIAALSVWDQRNNARGRGKFPRLDARRFRLSSSWLFLLKDIAQEFHSRCHQRHHRHFSDFGDATALAPSVSARRAADPLGRAPSNRWFRR